MAHAKAQKHNLSSSSEGQSCDRCWSDILPVAQVHSSVMLILSLLNIMCLYLLWPILSLEILTCSSRADSRYHSSVVLGVRFPICSCIWLLLLV